MNKEGKTFIIVAGLGTFYGAGRRLYLQLHELGRDITPVLVNAEKLSKIAKKNGIDEKLFSHDVRGYGFWQWKPLLIYHYLNEAAGEAGGKVIYIDSGCEINPSSLSDFILWFSESDFKLLLSKTNHNISNYTKPDVVNELNKNKLDPHKYEMLQACFVCIKIDSNIKIVFREAYKLILNGRQDLYNDNARDNRPMPEYFVDHRHDQSVLSLLILNSPYIDEVGVIPSGLTPPNHREWCPFPPVIAARNSNSVSLYWPLIKYLSKSQIPGRLKFQIRIMNKIAAMCGHHSLILNLIQKIMNLEFRELIKAKDKSLDFVLTPIISPPILMPNKK